MNSTSSRLSTSDRRTSGFPRGSRGHGSGRPARHRRVIPAAPMSADARVVGERARRPLERSHRVQVYVLVDERDVHSFLASEAPWLRAAPAVGNAPSVLSTGRYSTVALVSVLLERAIEAASRTSASLKTQIRDTGSRRGVIWRSAHARGDPLGGPGHEIPVGTRQRSSSSSWPDSCSSRTRLIRRYRVPVNSSKRQIVAPVGLGQLLDAAADAPLRPASGSTRRSSSSRPGRSACPARRRPRTTPCAGHDRLDDRGDVADPVVLALAPTLNASSWTSSRGAREDGQEGARDVLDVDQRPPRACRRSGSAPRRSCRVPDQVVDHDVDSQPRRDP